MTGKITTICAGVNFIDSVLDEVFCGEKNAKHNLTKTIIYLPTRRLVKEFKKKILLKTKGKVLLMPQIVAFDDDENFVNISFFEDHSRQNMHINATKESTNLEQPCEDDKGKTDSNYQQMNIKNANLDKDKSINYKVEGGEKTNENIKTGNEQNAFSSVVDGGYRKFWLASMVLEFYEKATNIYSKNQPREISLLSAFESAGLLCKLFDDFAKHQIKYERLGDFFKSGSLNNSSDFADHWSFSLIFLNAAHKAWTHHLDELELLDIGQHSNLCLEALDRHLKNNTYFDRVFLCGAVGTYPAVTKIMQSVANLDGGHLFLSGYFKDMTAGQKTNIVNDASHPLHTLQVALESFTASNLYENMVYKQENTYLEKLLFMVFLPARDSLLWANILNEKSTNSPETALANSSGKTLANSPETTLANSSETALAKKTPSPSIRVNSLSNIEKNLTVKNDKNNSPQNDLRTQSALQDKNQMGGKITAQMEKKNETLHQEKNNQNCDVGKNDRPKTNREQLKKGFENLSFIALKDINDEALTIALIMRKQLESADKTCALITANRQLSRSVISIMKRWNVNVDDSSGKPLSSTAPAIFMRLVLDVFISDFSTSSLASLLKHPFCNMNIKGYNFRTLCRSFEMFALLGCSKSNGLEGIKDNLIEASKKSFNKHSRYIKDVYAMVEIIYMLERAFKPLENCASSQLCEIVEAHILVCENLNEKSQNEKSTTINMWAGDDGQCLASAFAGILKSSSQITKTTIEDYANCFTSFLTAPSRVSVGFHSRLFIWGPLEARLQSVDVAIIGSLNEGIMPRPSSDNGWLSNAMLQEVGLPSIDHMIGVGANDLLSMFGSNEIIFTRAKFEDGKETIPSRWWQRFDVLRAAVGFSNLPKPDYDFESLSLKLDSASVDISQKVKISVPKPTPKISSRPKYLSASSLQTLLDDPYQVYAKSILKLQNVGELSSDLNSMDFGNLVHKIFEIFIIENEHLLTNQQSFSAKTTNKLERKLGIITSQEFKKVVSDGIEKIFWQVKLTKINKGFLENLLISCINTKYIKVEKKLVGELKTKNNNSLKITAIADRIDVFKRGHARIIDYKTGGNAGLKKLQNGTNIQLSLEAFLLQDNCENSREFEYNKTSKTKTILSDGRNSHKSIVKKSNAINHRTTATNSSKEIAESQGSENLSNDTDSDMQNTKSIPEQTTVLSIQLWSLKEDFKIISIESEKLETAIAQTLENVYLCIDEFALKDHPYYIQTVKSKFTNYQHLFRDEEWSLVLGGENSDD